MSVWEAACLALGCLLAFAFGWELTDLYLRWRKGK